jgi:periplasmic protein TonB
MFTQLVESGSHRTDLARRGTFFAGTLACYSLLLVCAGVVSVFAYDAQISRENLDITYLTAAPLPEAPPERTPDRPHVERNAGDTNALPSRKFAVADINVPLIPNEISTQPTHVKPLPSYGALINGRDYDPPGVGTPGVNIGRAGANGGGVRVSVPDGEDPHPPLPTPAPTPKPAPPSVQRLTSQVISSKIISKPVPPYPIIAKQAGIYGVVAVEILIDERGRVISAQATSGHVLLREAARQAALQAVFSPTQLNGQPVKVSGVITYNFMLH